MRRLVLSLSVLLAITAAPAQAKVITTEGFQVNAFVALRSLDVLGFVPVVQMTGTRSPVTLRAGGKRYRSVFNNYVISRRDTDEALKYMVRDARKGYERKTDVLFADRPLRAAEKRYLTVAADLWREGDVLIVARDHPVCAGGLTLTQARQIGRGEITRWSQVLGTLPEGQPDTIALRYPAMGPPSDLIGVPRLGVRAYGKNGRPALDGGLSQVARDRAVAGIAPYSVAKRFPAGVCMVPLDGIAPTDATVMDRSFPGAYAITLVRYATRMRAIDRAKVTHYVNWFTSAAGKDVFRGRGMLVVGG